MLRVHEYAMLLDHHYQSAQDLNPIEVLRNLDPSIIDIYKAEWRLRILKSLRYPKNTIFVNMP